MNAPSRLEEFLAGQGVHPRAVDAERTFLALIAEIDAGLAGRRSSLPMLPTWLDAGREIDPANEREIGVMDAGGTNLRVARVVFRRGRVEVRDLRVGPMPGTRGAMDVESFYNALAAFAAPVVDDGPLGFCFSYPMENLASGDGRVISLTKEAAVAGIEGSILGESLGQALERGGRRRPASTVCLNDTTAVLFAGAVGTQARGPSSSAESIPGLGGFVLGTGANGCHHERATVANRPPQVYVLEAGAFEFPGRGSLDRAFDATTQNPGHHPFEKMYSGGYLPSLARFVAEAAAAEGFLRPEAVDAAAAANAFETRHIDEFLRRGADDDSVLRIAIGGYPETAEAFRAILRCVVDRAAVCAGILLAALAVKAARTTEGQAQVRIAVEGTTFLRLAGLRSAAERLARSLAAAGGYRHVDFVHADNATLVGAAAAALSRHAVG